MPIAYIEDVGNVGILRDAKPHELPLNAWSDGKNVRFTDQGVQKVGGYDDRLGAASVAPYFLLPVPTAGAFYWLYAGLAKVYALSGSTHTNVTRQTASVDVNYTGTVTDKWTGGILGGIPVLSNGVDAPQMWNPVGTGTKLAALTNWPASTTAKSLRAFKQYLVALDVTKTGTRYPHMVKWSHPADPGAVPSSWDETDTSKDAGEYNLMETPGFVVDSLRMRDTQVIYKEDAVWGMQYIGGNSIFRFWQMFSHVGMLSRNCMAEYAGRHYVFTGSDVVVHDGQQAQTLLDSRARKWLQNNVDSTYYYNSFVFILPQFEEVWVCVPTTGNQYCNIALIIKVNGGAVSFRELPGLAHAGIGAVDPAAVSDTWDSASGVWDTDSTVWESRLYSPANKRPLAASPLNTKLYALEYSEQDDGANMTAYIERLGIGAIPEHFDMTQLKLFKGIIPRIEGTFGGALSITPYVQMEPGGTIMTLPTETFTIGASNRINAFGTGKLLGFRISSSADITWSLHGYGVEYELAGRY